MKITGIDIRGLCPLLEVFDMPASIHFYCEVLGFSIVTSAEPPPTYGWTLLRLNGTELMIEPAYEKGKRPLTQDSSRNIAHRDTGLYFGCPNIDEAYTLLLSKGINLQVPRITFYGMKQLYITDPDNYVLCLQWPANETTDQQWKEWYDTKK